MLLIETIGWLVISRKALSIVREANTSFDAAFPLFLIGNVIFAVSPDSKRLFPFPEISSILNCWISKTGAHAFNLMLLSYCSPSAVIVTTKLIGVLLGTWSETLKVKALSCVDVAFELILENVKVSFVIVTYSESVDSTAVPFVEFSLPTFFSSIPNPE